MVDQLKLEIQKLSAKELAKFREWLANYDAHSAGGKLDRLADAARDVIQLKVTLKGVKPSIWRQIEVPASYTFWELHVAIQDAMGWLDYHLHVFRVRNTLGKADEIGIPD